MSVTGADGTMAASVRTFPQLGTLQVTGPDAARWLNGVLTCDVSTCRPGQATWGLCLDRKGKIQSVVWVVAQAGGLLLGVSSGTATALFTHLDRMLVMEDAELADVSDRYAWALCGFERAPGSWELPQAAHEPQRAHALRLVTLDAYAVCLDKATPPTGRDALTPLEDAAWSELRLIHGIPEYGVDFGPGDRPHEAGLERRAVDWSKGCYLGQEVVCMQDMRGKVSRRATLLRVEGMPAEKLSPGAEVTSSEAPTALGQLTSCVYSPRIGAWLGLAMLPVARLGSQLAVQAATTSLRAEPVTPPVQPNAR